MGWLRSFLDPLPSLYEQRERERAIMAHLADLPIPVTIVMEHDKRGKPFYSWTVGTPGTPNPWGISAGGTTEFHVEEAYAALSLIETQVDELRAELEYQHKRLDEAREAAFTEAHKGVDK